MDNNNTNGIRRFRPSLMFFKANARGTGGAASFELHPAHKDIVDGNVVTTDGSIMASLASQLIVGDMRGPNPTFPRFDWDNKICVKLDFTDLCKMLQVFRGECESLGDGKGLYHRSPGAMTRIILRHTIEPTPGYVFEVFKNLDGHPDSDLHANIFFDPSEAMGLMLSIQNSIGFVAFGIPEVIPHDTSSYRARTKTVGGARVA